MTLGTMVPPYVKPVPVSLRRHQVLNERWVQDRLAEDPSLLGLGDVILRDRERPQPHAGRLDLLFQDAEEDHRYEVELQLGATDESHIIRTIEYWDLERKRYPQYDHTAVIVAEQITSRFLNVISLFNGQIPLIAIQMQAIQVGDQVGLVFTKVLDRLERGADDEDEGSIEVTDRSYWEKRSSSKVLALADTLFSELKKIDPRLEPRYTKFYVGTGRDGLPRNFVLFRPRKGHLGVELKLERSEDIDRKLEAAGLDGFDYLDRWRIYRLKLGEHDLRRTLGLLGDLMKTAHDQRGE